MVNEQAERGLRPLARGTRVATTVVTEAHAAGARELVDATRAAYGGPCDVVVVAVPAGDGVAAEFGVRRALGVETAAAQGQEASHGDQD